MNIHFKLRQQGKKPPIIMLHVYDARFKGRKFMYSTGLTVDAAHWDKKKSRAKPFGWNVAECTSLNDRIDKIENAVTDFRSRSEDASLLDREDLKKFIQDWVPRQQTKPKGGQPAFGFFEAWNQIIATTKNSAGTGLTHRTKVSKSQTLRLVQQYAAARKVELSFEKIDMAFYHDLDLFMRNKGFRDNNRGKHFKEIKAVLREALDRDIKVNMSFQKKSWRVIRADVDNIYLDENEISRLLNLDVQGRLEVTRDIFVMACFVGARYSDWHQIHPRNLTSLSGKELLKIHQKKTGDITHVPLHPVVRMIFNKYKEAFPKIVSLQKFNEALKELCQLADLGTSFMNGQEVERWTLVSTHTARRSFATNAYLSRSMDVFQIMKCTGHKSESSFLKYLKLHSKDFAIQAADSAFFKNTYILSAFKA